MSSRGLGIAIIGMSGRFPGADSTELFWKNLCAGTESITRCVADADCAEPRRHFSGGLVRSRGVIEHVDRFDAGFFSINPREAADMDPQHRIFLECAWHALEDAGYAAPDRPRTGVYAACGPPSYLLSQFCRHDEDIDDILYRNGRIASVLNGNDRDMLPLRTAYKLDLQGPAVAVQSACSSSLVAVVEACKSLLAFESDLCLAGGAHIVSPQVDGYFYQAGGIHSRDGRCLPFDRDATGTIFSDGVAIVVLRRLRDAVEAGDRIDAVITGWGVNNDGAHKASLSAPSARGQADATRQAHQMAGVKPADIQYVETHGTGTVVGDEIEVAGLEQVWNAQGGGVSRCGIGSVKSNIGHLDVGAGVAGLIKTALALKHRQIPASLGCRNPLRILDKPQSPFYVVDRLMDWPDSPIPGMAGVNSLGVGGTNCHLVLESAPQRGPDAVQQPGAVKVLALSARSPEALRNLARDYSRFLQTLDASRFADVCYTASVGRRHFEYRLAICAADAASCASRLAAWLEANRDPERVPRTKLDPGENRAAMQPEAAARLYRDGADIDWSRFHENAQRKRVAIPLYPFQRQSYWRHPATRGSPEGTAYFGKPMELPGSREARFAATWDADNPPCLRDHLLFGAMVVPASCHIAAMVMTARRLGERENCQLERIHFERPLVVTKPAAVQLVYADPRMTSCPVSLMASSGGVWRQYVAATMIRENKSTPAFKLHEALGRCTYKCSGRTFYQEIWAQGELTGPSFRWITSVNVGASEAITEIKQPTHITLGESEMHPGIFEAMFQTLYCCGEIETQERVASTQTVLVPARIDRITVHGGSWKKLYAHARLRPGTGESVVGDLKLIAGDGRVLAAIEGFELRPMHRKAVVEDTLPAYEIDWMPDIDPPDPQRRSHPPGWLAVVPPRHQPGRRFADLKGLGIPMQELKWTGEIDLDMLSGGSSDDPLNIAYLCPLGNTFDPDNDDLRASLRTVMAPLFSIARHLRLRDRRARLVVFTEGAQTVSSDTEPACPMHSALWGFVRVMGRELPNINIRIIDMEPGAAPQMDAFALELGAPDENTQVAWRGGKRFTARLARTRLESEKSQLENCHSYYVAGDGSGQDVLVAGWLEEQGKQVSRIIMRDIGGDSWLRNAKRPMPGRIGMIQTAVGFTDNVIQNMTWPDLEAQLLPAMQRLLDLHTVCRRERFEDFVLFNSASAVLGNPGQSGYAALSGFADGLVRYRTRHGEPGKSIHWGAWQDVGKWPSLTRRQKDRLTAAGVLPIRSDQGLNTLGRILGMRHARVCVPAVIWREFPPVLNQDPFYDGVEADTSPGRPERKQNLVVNIGDGAAQLCELVASELGLNAAEVSTQAKLTDLGMDSLDAVNILEQIERSFAVNLTLSDVIDAGSLVDLSDRIQRNRSGVDSDLQVKAKPANPATNVPRGETAIGYDESIVMCLTPDNMGTPWFVVPADSSTALSMKALVDAVGRDRPVYGFQAPGLDNDDGELDTIDGLALRYVEQLLRIQPDGGYTLMGRCTGGLAAFAMALELQRRGARIAGLVLLETLPPAVNGHTTKSRMLAGIDQSCTDADWLELRRRAQVISREIQERIRSMPAATARRFARVQTALDRAVGCYAPERRFSGKLHCVRCVEEIHPVQERWRDFVDGTVEFVDVPGNHATMLGAANIRTVGRILSGFL